MIVFVLLTLFLRFRFFRKNLFYGLAQDGFVIWEISRLPVFSQMPLLCLAQVFLLLDASLYWQIKTRLQPSHFFYFKQISSFWDSAAQFGLYRFMILGVLLAIASIWAGPSPPLPLWAGTLFLSFAILGLKRLKPGAAYRTDSALFRLQLYIIPRRQKALLPRSLPVFLAPENEKSRFVSPQFPLLKYTSCFFGEKQVDLPLPSKKPNVIFLFLESFRARDISKRATPFFESLKEQGIFFSQFYSNGVLTHQAIISSLYSLYPFFGSHRDRSLFDEPRQKADFATLPLIGIPDLMKQAGYQTAYIDAALALESEKKFYLSHGFDVVQGRDDFAGASSTSWGVYDEYLMRHLALWINKNRERPLFVTGFTVSNHHPWQTPEGYGFDLFEDIEDEVHRKFLRTLRYSDHCLELFFEHLKEAKQDSIIFILGDHGQGMNEHGLDRLQNSVYEENIHIPLLILAPGIQPQRIDAVGSQVDLMPTVMDLLGLKGLNHCMGSSLLRRREKRPLFFNNSHIGFSLGCRIEGQKYVMTDLLERKEEMFDLKKDPLEQNPYEAPEAMKIMAQECYDFVFSLFARGNIAYTLQQVIDCSGQVKLSDVDLEKLLEKSCKPYALNLSGCLSITDAGLKAIAPYCTHLRSLNLSECMVTEKGVEAIVKRAPHLKDVDLTNCLLMDKE